MNNKHWAHQVAAAFKRELPQEFLDMWRNDLTYVFPFQKNIIKKVKCAGMDSTKIENMATEILNKYWTQLVREQL